jgi:nucleoid-associated protein YgaU
VKTKTMLQLLFMSLILSSCGLFDKSKSNSEGTESTADASTEIASESTTELADSSKSDDLFSSNSTEPEKTAASDAPNNITTEPEHKDEMNQLQKDFVVEEHKNENKEEPKVEKVALNAASNDSQMAIENGEVKEYRVQKGETLMQIAFKLYGDISKWKELKKLNGSKLSKNSALRNNMALKYYAPASPFVWNPEGNPYMIKNGETLGIISNNVYHTPKKWKAIYENNKPLIKNPNVIYAGFTLYYKGESMANYVQPVSKKVEKADEEIKVEKALSEIERLDSPSEEVRDIRSATTRKPSAFENAESEDLKQDLAE